MGVKGYRPSKFNAARHRERMGDAPPTKELTSGMSEAEVVMTKQLAAIIRRWVSHSADANALTNLGENIGMDEAFIRRIVGEKSKYTALRNADRLLTGMGLGYLLQNGEVTVIPNPMWSMEKYITYMENRGCI